MASVGCILRELTPGGQVINEYACASKAIARSLIEAIIPRNYLEHAQSVNPRYTLRNHEFTDSEYPSTIGYLSTLSYEERSKYLYVQYGETIV